MRWKPLLWFLVSICCFIGAVYFWRLGDRWSAEKRGTPSVTAPEAAASNNAPVKSAGPEGGAFHLQTTPASLTYAGAPQNSQPAFTNQSTVRRELAYRLSNSSKSARELAHSQTAVLLENALIDTEAAGGLNIPEHLRAQGDPGTYIVQARVNDPAFRAYLERSGARVVSYIPNNAWLVRASESIAHGLRTGPQTQAVLPYEPYFKLKQPLLKIAAHTPGGEGGVELPPDALLNVLLFADARESAMNDLERLGAEIINEQRSPFGPIVRVRPPSPRSLTELAAMPGVQAIELARVRIPANDLSRAALAVSPDPISQTNYLGLTGTNVLMTMVESGVDATHPGLAGRVFLGDNVGLDLNGHGTHVAGIMIGTGAESTTVTNAQGSIMPPVEDQFRGKAPNASLLALDFEALDAYLQETTASSNAFISDNSWNYAANDYDMAAASYDAAVRDSLPFQTGSQPVLYVFAAGNAGSLNEYFGSSRDGGGGGLPDSILSPATAKNVITVGAVEQFRDITNEVVQTVGGNSVTNTTWRPMTDSNDEVAGYSGRGNVGVGIEGESGRFKPDVVAPGSFIISTRSSTWDESSYYASLSQTRQELLDLIAGPGQLWGNSIFVPGNAVSVMIEVLPNAASPTPFPTLPIYVRQAGPPTNTPGGYDFVKQNGIVMMPPDNGPTLSPKNTGWFYAIGNDTDRPVSFDLVTTLVFTNEGSTLLTSLSNLNSTLGPFYRYESGTSLAAAGVAGTLGLMQEYFEQRLGRTNSPALMKGLLINGARSLGNPYSREVQAPINYQGWGQVYLPGSVHAGFTNGTPDSASMLVFDQHPTNALATGQSRTFDVAISPEGREFPLKVTLVWTDPPGNPVAGVKLVNDLDLVVTNRETGEVYFGNDITTGSDYNRPWNTNSPPNIDTINNVENVFISPSFFSLLGTNISVTVVGKRVNVNAVSDHPNDVVQDFALVIASGDGEITNALSLTTSPVVSTTEPYLTVITNMFSEAGPDVGGVLMNQRVGASSPLLGSGTIPLDNNPEGRITLGVANQWHFYTLTNNTDYTNAAFLTFLPPNLSPPRMGARERSPENASRPEADIDLYVSADPRLLALEPGVVAAARKSLGAGGTETIVFTNVSQATMPVFYIGVKAEDQRAAEYAILGVISELPFSTEDANGNQLVRGLPIDSFIPDGNPQVPGVAHMFGIAVSPIPVRRVIVTNTITHELMGDLIGTLRHGGYSATLNNHTTNLAVFNRTFIYDDSGELDVPFSQRSDGPGSLQDFGGQEGIGQWLLTQIDNAPGHVGTNVTFGIFLERQQDLEEGITVNLQAGATRLDYVEVPGEATNLTIRVNLQAGTGPIFVEVCPLEGLPTDCVSGMVTNVNGIELTITTATTPSLIPGTYVVRTRNDGPDEATVNIRAFIYLNQDLIAVTQPSTGGPTRILDDAVTYSTIDINARQRIQEVDVGMLIRHERISDLAITLIAPDGTRVLLFENRGGTSTAGLGSFLGETSTEGVTNLVTLYSADFDTTPTGLYARGTHLQGWSVLDNIVGVMPDFSIPWRESRFVLLADGAISNTLPMSAVAGYQLAFEVTHAPHLVGTVGWWPMEGDAADIFSGIGGVLRGNVLMTNGLVGQAYYGDGSATRMIVDAAPELNVGIAPGMTIEGWIYPSNTAMAAPLVQWANPVNDRAPGLQLWLSDLSTNVAVEGALSAAVRGVDGSANIVSSAPLVVTNAGWQHVALTYDSATLTAQIYVNGTAVAAQAFTNAFTPMTGGDLYFGFDPTRNPGRSYAGGLDEFGLYERVLTECELQAIVRAGSAGKYGTNVLTCPVALEVDLQVGASQNTYTFTNGAGGNWLSGPRWETNVIDFANPSGSPASVVFRPLDPNVAIDNIRLLTLTSNSQDGLLHFTDNTNFASLPIKFAQGFQVTNVTIPDLFAASFVTATSGVYQAGQAIPGMASVTNAGTQAWSVVTGPVTVVSDPLLNYLRTNSLSLSTGVVEMALPTVPGHRYRLGYRQRGPGAVSWWNGDVNPLNRRAFDLLGGNDGAFIGASSQPTGAVTSAFFGRGPSSLYFPGAVTNEFPSKVELGDPENLRLTNSMTIEAWIMPVAHTNGLAREQILFRGDSRPCLDPYFLALDNVDGVSSDLRFHIEGPGGPACGDDLVTTGGVIERGTNWQHVAAVFELGPVYELTVNGNVLNVSSNQMRLYVDGQLVASRLTSAMPMRELDPAYSPGIAIGNRSRENYSEPFHGYIDELTVYGRALTDAEILAIGTSLAGKADLSVPMSESLSQLEVRLNNTLVLTSHGNNAEWSERTFVFTARQTNTMLRMTGLLPGTFIDSVSLAEIPGELSFLPEQALDILNGKDAFGTWTLEVWDTRTGAIINDPTVVTWQLDFRLLPRTLPEPVELTHGITFAGTVGAGDIRTFVVNVPQWAQRATNVLLYAQDGGGNPASLGVLYNTNFVPTYLTNTLFWPPVGAGTNVLTTQAGSRPPLWVGQPYYLTVTNPMSVAVSFEFGVWFDIQTLELCQPAQSVVQPAGIPRYFQFDVPASGSGELPRNVSFWLTGVNTNVTVVLSQSLPLPDLDDYDYISQAPSTNDEIVMVLPTSTPFPLQTNRWYIGVFNTGDAPVPFTAEACYVTETPTIISLTNGVPFTVNEATNTFAAPPGPPRWVFFEFEVTNQVGGVLFELYGLSGDADLVLQRDTLPTMAPYFRTSYMWGTNAEQIVLRPGSHTPDLRGRYFLGIYNNETTPVTFTIRAAVTEPNGLLVSGQAPRMDLTPIAGRGPLLGWNAVIGEGYTIQFSPSLLFQVWSTIAQVTASTPYATYQVPSAPPGGGYYRIVHGIVPDEPPLGIGVRLTYLPNGLVRVSWSTNFVDWRLQFSDVNFVSWQEWDTNARPITIEGDEYATYDQTYPWPRYYRLWQGPLPPPSVLVTNLIITVFSPTQLRIEWPTNLVDYRLQWAEPDFIWREWDTNRNPITINGTNYMTFDDIGPVPRYYRLYNGPIIQPPDEEPPALTFNMIGTNTMEITWPTVPPGYWLQYSDDFQSWINWDTNTNPVRIVGGMYVTEDIVRAVPRFYRIVRGIPETPPPTVGFNRIGTNQIEVIWPAVPPGYWLQYTDDFFVWHSWDTNTNPVRIEGNNYIAVDLVRETPRYYRVVFGASPPPPGPPSLSFRKVSEDQIQITWPVTPPGYRLQYTEGTFVTWNEWDTNAHPITIEGSNYVTFDEIPATPRFYRLFKDEAPPGPHVPPVLGFSTAGPNEIRISWPVNPPGYRLQYTELNFLVWNEWDTNANPIQVLGEYYVTTDTLGGPPRFYRLVPGAVPEPPPTSAPALTFTQLNATQMYLAWPTNWTGYQLAYTDGNLTNWVVWNSATNPVAVVGTNYVLIDEVGTNGFRFYRLMAPSPTPEPPGTAVSVSMSRISENEIKISWPAASGYRLEFSNGGLGNWQEWDTVATPAALVGQQYEVIDALGQGARYYRLVRP